MSAEVNVLHLTKPAVVLPLDYYRDLQAQARMAAALEAAMRTTIHEMLEVQGTLAAIAAQHGTIILPTQVRLQHALQAAALALTKAQEEQR